MPASVHSRHVHAPDRAAAGGLSLLQLSALQRLALAAPVLILLWAGVYWAMG